MDVEISEHARRRMRQRAIPMFVVDLLLRFGKIRHANGAIRLDFDRRGRRQAETYLGPARLDGKAFDTYAVVSDNVLITIGHRTERFTWN